ncbi:hypothetical protein [Candidatus Njordibacter sp. Uisw_002]|uniref:hypothetical protein n=1 Tax=Candidatus Njordibacter sp. Uisw_002 TaxID=3230971 RepID=UPI003D568BB8
MGSIKHLALVTMSSTPSVKDLLTRGDELEIVDGRLNIIAESGLPVTAEWLKLHEDKLVYELVSQMAIDVLVYESYSTGRYGAERNSGVNLQFINLLTDDSRYAVFNADLDRVKATKKGPIGSPLPSGQFRVGKRSRFCRFWLNANQPLPPRLSSFHDYMGNLKGTLFTGVVVREERLDKQSIKLLNITYVQIAAAFFPSVLPDNPHTPSIHSPYKYHTAMPYNESMKRLMQRGLEPIQTTGNCNYGTSSLASKVTRGRSIVPTTKKIPQDQTVEEWLEDYDL